MTSNRWKVAALGVLCATTAAAREHHPGPALFAAERAAMQMHQAKLDGLRAILPPTREKTPRVAVGDDFISLDLDATLDPMTGVTTATAKYTVAARANGINTAYMLIDEGLVVADAFGSENYEVTVSEYPYPPYNYVILSISPAVPPGKEITLEVTYGGTLKCTGYEGYAGRCSTGSDKFLFLNHASLQPEVLDGSIGWSGDRMSRTVTLRVPSGLPVFGSAEKLFDSDDGQTHVTTWKESEDMPAWFSLIFITGKVASTPISGTSMPSELIFETGSTKWNDELSAWTPPIFAHLDEMAGEPLPFPKMHLVKIPAASKFIGTVAAGMTLLADSYAGLGAEGFEEIWAHENAHQWWATIAAPDDYLVERTLTEGLATLTQYDYTAARHHAGEDRDLYMAKRFRETDLYLRYLTKDLPPLLVSKQEDVPDEFYAHQIWAYFKSSAMLDHLRTTLGEPVFAKGMRNYVAACRFKPCDLGSLRDAMEAASQIDLAPFFSRFISSAKPVPLSVAFEHKAPGQIEVTLIQDDVKPLGLELWLELEDGSRQKERVYLTDEYLKTTFTTASPVVRVRPNPRHDVMVQSRSAVAGDLSFDGVSEGIDVLRCAHLEGADALSDPDHQSYYGVNLRFDPRCDLDADGVVSRQEIDTIAETIGIGSAP